MFDHVKRLHQQAIKSAESNAPTALAGPSTIANSGDFDKSANPFRLQVHPAYALPDALTSNAQRMRPDQEPLTVDLNETVHIANTVLADASDIDDQPGPVKDFTGMPISEQSAVLLGEYRKSRIKFGMARMRMGAFLHIIKSNKLWEGVAESFDSFIAAENINPHAARQYMSVAKTFIFDMKLSEEVLSKLSIAGISALDKASKLIGEENRDELVEILANLSERDAIQRIMEMSTSEVTGTSKPALRVLRLLREYYEMPPDLQFDFLGKLSDNRRNQEAIASLTAAAKSKRQSASARASKSELSSDDQASGGHGHASYSGQNQGPMSRPR